MVNEAPRSKMEHFCLGLLLAHFHFGWESDKKRERTKGKGHTFLSHVWFHIQHLFSFLPSFFYFVFYTSVHGGPKPQKCSASPTDRLYALENKAACTPSVLCTENWVLHKLYDNSGKWTSESCPVI